jgi:3D (Asp-Asp-Asp) domain-containing protein
VNLKLIAILIGHLTITAYRSTKAQTDNSPNWTSIGKRTCEHGIAVSQELLKQNGGPINYLDWVYVEGIGLKQVTDCMNKRYKNRVDVWVSTYKEEHEFYKKFHALCPAVYVVRTTEEKNDPNFSRPTR